MPSDRDPHGRSLYPRGFAQGQPSVHPPPYPQPSQYPPANTQWQQYPPAMRGPAATDPGVQPSLGRTLVPLAIVLFFAAIGALAVVGAARSSQRAAASASASIAATTLPPTPAITIAPPVPKAAESAVAVPAPVVAKPRRRLNVLFITIDTLRHDLGFAGYPRPITPHLDALAKESAVFEHAYSLASYTPKSMGPMMIGRYGSETFRNGEHYTKFASSNVFLAERAHDAGLRTFGGVCHRYFMWKMGFEQGMDIYDMSAAPPNPTDDDVRLTSEALTDVAIKLLGAPENHRGQFYAWFHYIDPHTPYIAHPDAPPFAKMPPEHAPSQRAMYDAEVWYTDQHVGRLLDYVASQPWAKDTAIVVTADHGEAFGEHDHWRHGRELWEPLIRVPLIVHLPDGEGRRIAIKRSHIDLVPTLMDLMGLPPDPSLHGTSLLADILAPPDARLPERDLFVDMMKGPYNEERRAVITGPSPGIKLIDFEGARTEVYDLSVDPLETKPLKKGDPRYVAATEAYDRVKKTLVPGKLVP